MNFSKLKLSGLALAGAIAIFSSFGDRSFVADASPIVNATEISAIEDNAQATDFNKLEEVIGQKIKKKELTPQYKKKTVILDDIDN